MAGHRVVFLALAPCAVLLGLASGGGVDGRAAGGGVGCADGRGDGEELRRGAAALARLAREWGERRDCVSCHTNGWALAALPVIAPESAELKPGRAFAREYLTRFLDGEDEPHGQHGSVEGMVSTAAFLALSDARLGGPAHPVTLRALDHAWGTLGSDGVWEDWLRCNWPPYESDLRFGPTLMLVALGELREAGGLRAADRRAARLLADGLREQPPPGLHDAAMRLWAAASWPRVASRADRTAWRTRLIEAVEADGGWSMASLAAPDWKRDGGEPQTAESEAYPTALAAYVLLRTGASPDDAPVARALAWLRARQGADGTWTTRSPRRDGKHYLSRAATALALLALADEGG
ncbi:MAG: hypothetical protein QF903_04070 [Planctomycetota bacterium]|jgi:hypothetical protein|nr:hypothetical protein [Planctomycetota bacterium]MDP6988634.1 hypothetical protein [Planctomycetota bacterium]